MKKAELKNCVKIVNKLSQRPIFKVFESESNDYLEKIQERLLSNTYSSMDDFIEDMEVLFEYMEQIAKESHSHQLCYRELRLWYRKKMEKFNKNKNKKIRKEIEHLSSTIRRNLEDPPDILFDLKERTIEKSSDPFYRPFTITETEELSSALSKITSTRIKDGVIAILKAIGNIQQGTINSDLHLEVSKCSPQCLHTLKKYLIEQFKKEGIKYYE